MYFDTSVLVSMFIFDDLSERAEGFISRYKPAPLTSDFVAAEFAAALARRVRIGQTPIAAAQAALLAFDGWALGRAERIDCTTFDIRRAELYLRRLDLVLRAPDAIHLAITQRLNAELATFDLQMAACARQLGVALAPA